MMRKIYPSVDRPKISEVRFFPSSPLVPAVALILVSFLWAPFAHAVNTYVGIGTTSPSSQLHVYASGLADYQPITQFFTGSTVSGIHDDIYFGAAAAAYRGVIFRYQNGQGVAASAGLSFQHYGDSYGLYLQGGGNVGIGTTSPATALDLNGALSVEGMAAPARSSAGQGRIYFDSTSHTFQASQNGGAYAALGGNSQWTTSGSNIYYNTGNVGIGTTSPGYLLDVQSAGAASAQLKGTSAVLNLTSTGASPSYSAVMFNATGGNWAIGTQVAGCGSYFGVYSYSGLFDACLTASASWAATSDARLKKDIHPISNALEKIALVNGVTFHWKNQKQELGEQVGVIAQDVQKAFPQLVTTSEKTGMMMVNYSGLVAPLIEAVKELKARNATLESENAAVKAYLCDKDPSVDFCH